MKGVDSRTLSNVYPNVRSEVSGQKVELRTYLRIKGPDGNYYLQLFMMRGILPKEEAQHRLRTEVYIHMLYGVVEPSLKNTQGDHVFTLDKYQGEEKERLQIHG